MSGRLLELRKTSNRSELSRRDAKAVLSDESVLGDTVPSEKQLSRASGSSDHSGILGNSSRELGKAIQSARQKTSMTQQELCHQANLSYSTLAKIERGAIKTPSVFTVYRIAQVVGTTVDELLGSVVDARKAPSKTKRTSKSGISFVYFDVNGCLVRLFNAAFTQLSMDTGVPSDRIESAFWHFNDDVCRGDMDMDEFNAQFAAQLGIKSLDWNTYYLQAVRPVEEMQKVARWAADNYKVGLLSNIMPGQIPAMISNSTLPDLDYDAVVDSSDVRAIKPDAKMYEIAATEAGVPADEILLVDDTTTNLKAAESHGWKVMWFDDFHAQTSADKLRITLEF